MPETEGAALDPAGPRASQALASVGGTSRVKLGTGSGGTGRKGSRLRSVPGNIAATDWEKLRVTDHPTSVSAGGPDTQIAPTIRMWSRSLVAGQIGKACRFGDIRAGAVLCRPAFADEVLPAGLRRTPLFLALLEFLVLLLVRRIVANLCAALVLV